LTSCSKGGAWGAITEEKKEFENRCQQKGTKIVTASRCREDLAANQRTAKITRENFLLAGMEG